jgi:hypothetical protein
LRQLAYRADGRVKLGSPYEAEEFRDNFGRDRSGYVVNVGGRNYYTKLAPDLADAENDRLAHALSRGICNVPETVLPSADERDELAGLGFPEGDGTHLVRLCQDHAGEPMAAPTLDRAIAAELVFSLWIHRRDAHNGNRVYNGGVPMFFDFGAAFDSEPDDLFRMWEGPGYVPNWRLVELPQCATVSTQAIRARELYSDFALQPVTSIRAFWQEAETVRDAILERHSDEIAGVVTRTIQRPERAAVMVEFLREKSASLAADVERLRAMLGAIPYDAIEGGLEAGPALVL